MAANPTFDLDALKAELLTLWRQELTTALTPLAERVSLLQEQVHQLAELKDTVQTGIAGQDAFMEAAKGALGDLHDIATAARAFEAGLRAGPTVAAASPTPTPAVKVPASARVASAPTASAAPRVAVPQGARNEAAPRGPSPLPGFARRTASLGVGAAPPTPVAAVAPTVPAPAPATQGDAFRRLQMAIAQALGETGTLDPVKRAIAEAKLKQWATELAAVGQG